MRTKLHSIVLVGLLSIAAPSLAIDPNVPHNGLPSASTFSSTLLPELQGAVSWKTLAQVEPVQQNSRMTLRFSKDVLALDQQQVRIQGFIVPLDLGGDQKHFLLSAVPPSCPYCMPAGPEALVEVFTKKSVAYGLEPIIVGGKLAVLQDDSSGLLYRLKDAETIQARRR